jgi:His-Xaa-Ser system protein HxsD
MDNQIETEPGTADVDETASGQISLDPAIYPGAAITRACYALADIATFEVSSEAKGFTVRIFPRPGLAIAVVTKRFRESLVDFTLRENIEARTKGIRDLIWQTAFGEIQKRSRS